MSFRWTIVTAGADELLCRGEAPPRLLSPAEEAFLAGLRFPLRRRKWLLGRVAAKQLLGEALAADRGSTPLATAITVANEPSGQPYATLDGERLPWTLSISHRGLHGLAVLADAPGRTLGADLETVEPRDPAFIRAFFTPGEVAAVAELSEGTDLVVARTWSAKEAVLKALGVGLRRDPREVEITGCASPAANGWSRLTATVGDMLMPVLWRDARGHVVTVALA